MSKYFLIFVFLLYSTNTYAQIAQVDVASASGTGTTTLDITGVDVSGTNKVLYAAITDDTGGVASSTMTVTYDVAGNNQTMTEVADLGNPGQLQALFRLIAPGDGTNVTITITGIPSSNSHTGIAVALSGVDQTTPNDTIEQLEAGVGLSISSGTIVNPTGDWIASFIALGANFTALSVLGSGNTIRSSVQSSGPSSAQGYADDRDGVDDTIDWLWTTDQRNTLFTFNINAAAGGASTAPQQMMLGLGP